MSDNPGISLGQLEELQKQQPASPQVEQPGIVPKKVQSQRDPNNSFMGSVIRQDWSLSHIIRPWIDPTAPSWMNPNGRIAPQADYDITAPGSEQKFNDLTDGLSQTAKDNIAINARSWGAVAMLAGYARKDQADDDYMSSYGGWGIAGRLGGSMLDPTLIALAAGSGGAGVISKTERLVKAAEAVAGTAERQAAMRAALAESRGLLSGSVAKDATLSGVRAAAENTVLTQVTNQDNMNRDGWDVAYAAIGGLALGTAFGRVGSASERRAVGKLHQRITKQLENEELRTHIADTQATINSAIGSADAATARVNRAYGTATDFIGSRNTDTSNFAQMRRILESGNNPNARASTSTATGADQFLEGTWLGTVSQAKPEWAKGLSRDELLKLRTDPAKSGEMADFLTAQNAKVLKDAGAPVNDFNLYAAWHFGPEKGKRFALASGDVPVENILSKAQIDANPYLRGLTKAEAVQNWAKRAHKGGYDLKGAMRPAADSVEALRDSRIASTNPDELNANLKAAQDDLKSTVDERNARLKELQKSIDENPVLPSGQERKLTREVDALQRQLRETKDSDPFALRQKVEAVQSKIDALEQRHADLTAQYHAEDVASLGADVAGNKQRTKLRKGAVDKVISGERKGLDSELSAANDALGRTRYGLKEKLQGPLAALEKSTTGRNARETLKALQNDADYVKLTSEKQAKVDQFKQALGLHNDDLAAQKATNVARDDASKLLDDAAVDQGHLDKLDALNTLQSASDLRKMQLDAIGQASPFGEDTLSAARTVGWTDDLFPSLSGTSSGEVGKTKLAGAQNNLIIKTFTGVLRGNDNEVVRNEFGRLVGNTLGNEGDTVNAVGASEIQSHIQRALMGQFNAAINPSYAKWLDEMGIGIFGQYKRAVRNQYMIELGLHIRGQASESAAVQEAATRVQGIFKEFLHEAKTAGVKGFENVEENPNFLPRVFNYHKFQDLLDRVGADQLEKLVAGGIKSTHADLDDKIAGRIAQAYIQRMRELRVGNDAGLMQGMSFDDVVFLRQFLDDAKFSSDDAEEIISKFAAAKTKGGKDVMSPEGGFRHAKARQQFDENFALELRDNKSPTGGTVKVTLSDLFENNVESLMGRYSRTMSGHTALAKIGIASAADFNARMKRVTNALEGNLEELTRVQKYAQAAYDLITARPLHDSTLWTELMRTGRDLSYTTQGANMGIASIPDFASLLAWGNLKYTLSALGDGMVFRAFTREATTGRMADDLLREVEEVFGIGTDFLNNQIYSSYDVVDSFSQELGHAERLKQKLSDAYSAVGHSARVGSRAVSAGSGLAGITSLGQRIAARNIIYKIKDEVFRGGVISEAKAAALGLDKPMMERIATQMKKYTSWTNGESGGKIQRVDVVRWTDTEARDAFLYAVHRQVKKDIQEQDLGDTLFLQHTPLGKFLTQFRSFALVGYTKQLLRSASEADAEMITRNGLQLLLAGAVFWLRNELKVKGMELAGVDPDAIQKAKDRNLTPMAIGTAAIKNAGFASLAPDIYDTTIGTLTGNPLFSEARNSGNSSNLLSGVPGFALAHNMGTVAADFTQAALRDDRHIKQSSIKALKAITPFGINLAVAPFFDALAEQFPKTDEDPDPDHADWKFIPH